MQVVGKSLVQRGCATGRVGSFVWPSGVFWTDFINFRFIIIIHENYRARKSCFIFHQNPKSLLSIAIWKSNWSAGLGNENDTWGRNVKHFRKKHSRAEEDSGKIVCETVGGFHI